MSGSEKPIFVFVPGAWHTADTFDGIREMLSQKGFDTEAVPTPSVGAIPPNKGLHADIEFTKEFLRKLADKGRQIVLVTHSYGGMVGANAVEGLGYSQRSKAGSSGGVIMVVWMAAFVTPKGQSLLDMLGGNWLPWMLPNDDGYTYSSQQETVFYHDMTPEAQQMAIAKLKGQPTQTFLEKVGYECWHDMPSMYLFCDKDQALPLAFQEAFAKVLGNPVTFHTDGSHSAFLSVPDQVIEALELALKEGRAQSGITTE
ncbi:uncharacterized protein N7477_007840 [Penicillium maclennaniae]|uniref:uncharacterized protein n=1 Tax=Penicillium maclennaniae TaxID=1343394 RepID=UPI0025420E6E|nr:uncharacterized protein N7477_007840 [Penicillium maclennaniae]KAJ5665392.1 hypothetical protein N7477_007840 [Penicillium maclennaniae]